MGGGGGGWGQLNTFLEFIALEIKLDLIYHVHVLLADDIHKL